MTRYSGACFWLEDLVQRVLGRTQNSDQKRESVYIPYIYTYAMCSDMGFGVNLLHSDLSTVAVPASKQDLRWAQRRAGGGWSAKAYGGFGAGSDLASLSATRGREAGAVTQQKVS